MMEELRYPIGRFQIPESMSDADLASWIDDIAALPQLVSNAVENLNEDQLGTAYRPDGWTLRQVVHHLVDSHLNAYVRCKWALTEDAPKIKTYEEALWAELGDYRDTPVEISLDLLGALHARWVILLRGLSAADLERTFRHPEWGTVDIRSTTAIYSWHGRHHLAHITTTAEREGW